MGIKGVGGQTASLVTKAVFWGGGEREKKGKKTGMLHGSRERCEERHQTPLLA